MRCNNCGRDIKDDFLFCPYCGIPTRKDNPEYYIRRCAEFRRKGKIRNALENCRRAAELSRDPYIFRYVGELAYMVGELDESIESYNKSLELLPDFPDTLYSLGIAFFRKGLIKRAIEAFERCLQVNPDFSMAYYWLGHSYYHIGRIEKAIDNFNKLLQHSPQSKIAHYHLGIAYHSKGEEEKALEHFKKLEEEKVEYASLFFHMGNVLYRLHNLPEAIRYLKKALEINPDEERAKRLLTRILEPPEV